MVFADADFFIGLYYTKDAHHENCVQISDSLHADIITSWDVVDEVATKLTYFADKNFSLRFLKRIFEDRHIEVVLPDYNLINEARKIFEGQKSHRISLTDCMNMAIAENKGITEFLSFDKVYEKNGFKLVE